jgi:hypothetical protein
LGHIGSQLGSDRVEFRQNTSLSSQKRSDPSSAAVQQDSFQQVPIFDCSHDEKHASLPAAI